MEAVRKFIQEMVDRIKTLWQKSPHLVFIGGIGLFALLVIVVTLIGRVHPNPPVSQPVNQPVRQEQAAQREGRPQPQQAQQQPQQQTQQPQQPQQQQEQQQSGGQAVVSWQGIYPQVAGPVELVLFNGTSLAGTDYSHPGLLIRPGKNSGSDYTVSVVFPLGGRYSRVTFTLAQPNSMGNLNQYAYGTALEISVDGERVLNRDIMKDALVSKDEPVTIELAGKNQLVVRLATHGKKVEKDGYTSTTDQYGPFMPVVLADLNFTLKQKGESVSAVQN
ncbi:hypothetical protein G7K71_02840 [Desulfofundulus sp. TPOSR]|uniref:hypothetical protein n=1 Tax=Desulfofundulus sp. TPOSR TaxID=2714340 RepID=UPI001409438A|nr:hypothetical protein [Desulfofundulus sp. TPOSR]NHM25963.1 hypothetical protein [Desulfofundulus sp. TPOSR]